MMQTKNLRTVLAVATLAAAGCGATKAADNTHGITAEKGRISLENAVISNSDVTIINDGETLRITETSNQLPPVPKLQSESDQ